MVFIPNIAMANISLFGYSEISSDNLSPFTKWQGMLERHPAHLDVMKQACDQHEECDWQHWQRFLASVRVKPISEKLSSINQFMNEKAYILDMVNWGVTDYWETLHEFFLKDGDCEDYAIAKYMSLKEVGVSPQNMRIVVLQDTNLDLLHSVLAVYDAGNIYVLDNQVPEVMEHTKIRHYTPIYSINEHRWWRHVP